MIIVSIVLLLKNAESFLKETLGAIYQQDPAFEYEVLAIDSGSTDQTLEQLKLFPVRLIRIPPEEFNHGETRNLGAREANPSSQYIVYLSQDAKPANCDWLTKLIAPLEADPYVAGVFSRHIPRPNSTPSMVRQLTTEWQTGGTTRLVKEMPISLAEFERDKFYYIYFSNTSSAIRREVWKKIPFRRVSFAEDVVWAEDTLRSGYKIVFEPDSIVVHSHDYNLIEQFRQNSDHTYAMKVLFDPQNYKSEMTWLRQVRAIPRQVWRDWIFIKTSSYFTGATRIQKIKWIWFSPWWHLASGFGAYIGAHLDRFPPAMRLFFSRQERMQRS